MEAALKAPYDENLASLSEVYEVESEAYEVALAIWKAAKDEAENTVRPLCYYHNDMSSCHHTTSHARALLPIQLHWA